MTVIAWDGKTLAADKLADSGGLKCVVTKLFRLSNGDLAAGSGDFDQVLHMIAWLDDGAQPENLPEMQADKDKYAAILVVTKNRTILKYNQTPYPTKFEMPFMAIGSGRDYAMAAMHLGKSAKEAVEVASALDTTCGMGVDVMTLED